jgi:hypothetical protein
MMTDTNSVRASFEKRILELESQVSAKENVIAELRYVTFLYCMPLYRINFSYRAVLLSVVGPKHFFGFRST